METPEPDLLPPVRIPQSGPPMTEDRKAAWISLDIASHAYRHNLDDPNKWALFRRALDNFHRAYKEAEEQYRDQRSSSETIG